MSDHSLTVELAPPALNVYVEKNLMHVNASFPLAACVESLFWMYDLDLWEVGSEYKVSESSTWSKERRNNAQLELKIASDFRAGMNPGPGENEMARVKKLEKYYPKNEIIIFPSLCSCF